MPPKRTIPNLNKIKKTCYPMPKEHSCADPPEIRVRKNIKKKSLPSCPSERKCEKWFVAEPPKVEISQPILPQADEPVLYNPQNVNEVPPSYIKLNQNLSPTLVCKSSRINSGLKPNPQFSNPVLKEIKVEEDTKVDGKVKPMTLKFSFWHKQAKTHSLHDKARNVKNKEVLEKVLKDSSINKVTEKPKELNDAVGVFDPDQLNEKKIMNLKTNFWAKTTKTVFLENKKKNINTEPYVSKDFVTPKVLHKVEEEQPMKLKAQFRSKDAKTVFLGKVI